MLLILFFTIVLNAVAIALTYHCLSNADKKEKLIFIAIGIAIIYVLTSFAYWISTKDVAIKEVSETGKDLITFLFVPINGIIILPIFAKSYEKYKIGSLGFDKLKNRGIVLAVLLIILLIVESVYFKDIQNSVIAVIEQNQQDINGMNQITNEQADEVSNELLNQISNGQTNEVLNELLNQISNGQTNEVSNELLNQISNEHTNEVSN